MFYNLNFGQAASSLPVKNTKKPIIPMPDVKFVDLDSNPSLEEVLLNPLTQTFFQNENPKLIKYFVDHVSDLLDYALYPNDPYDPHLSQLAFDYLNKTNDSIKQAYISNSILQHAAMPIVTNSNPSEKALNRISKLTLEALTNNPDAVPRSCGYICQFLSFINELSIKDFFDTVCSDDNTYKIIHEWLVSMNFALLIGNEINQNFPIAEYQYYDNSVQRMRHLFIIVRISLKSKILRPCFITESFFCTMTKTLLQTIYPIENERWDTLQALYCDETSDIFRSISGTIFQIFSDTIPEIQRYHVSALHILGMMINHDKYIRHFLIESNIHQALLRLLLQFPSHTFLHKAILHIFREAIEFPEFQKLFIENLVIPLVLEGTSSDSTVLVGTSFEIISKTLGFSKTSPDVVKLLQDFPEFMDFVKDVVVDRLKLIKNGYGGRIQYY